MTTRPSGLYDHGAQPERTLLAWRRTALALGVGSAAVVRFVTPVVGPLAVLVGLAGVALCALAYASTSARYRHVTGRLTGDEDVAVPASPGAACAALAGALVVVGLGALAFVLARALS